MFSSESRIIITTRDATMLRDIAVDGMYEVKQLEFSEALQLFNLIAFRGNSPDMDYMELSKKVVKRAGGIPLAIRVLGSHFRSLPSQSKESWEMALGKLKVVPHDKIQNALRVSYDGLDDMEKDIFLDIACFFKGFSRGRVEKILNACGLFANTGIGALIDKSLITISYGKMLWMHDLVQEMGQNIVRQECKEHGERSRLWIGKDAHHVLENNEGSAKIQGIFLDLSQIDEYIHLEPSVFQKMCNLQLLKVYDSPHERRGKLCLQDLKYLPHSLRYLEWHEYPLTYLPSNFRGNNLVELKMPYSQLEQLWAGVQDLNKLRHIERINLSHCTSLLQFPFHILPTLNRLIEVNLSYCNKLQSVSDRICDVAFHRTSALQRCSNPSTLPMTTTRSLVSLDLSSTNINSLPSSIISINLSELCLCNCTRLANLPSSMNKLGSLKRLHLGGCSILETFPELPWNITWLDIGGTAIKEVASSSIEGRFDLEGINLSDCKSLESLPTNIFKLRSLMGLNLSGCSNLRNLPEILEPMESLYYLNLSETGIKELPSSIERLVVVELLKIEGCKNFEFIPSTTCNMTSLKDLNLSNCPKLECSPILDCFLHWGHLSSLNLSSSTIIEIPASINGISNLRYLFIRNCKNLRSLPVLPLSLRSVYANGCTSLKVVSNLKRALTQEFWDDPDICNYGMEESMFCDCLELDKQLLQNILIDFRLRVLWWAKGFPIEPCHSIGACCPGNDIPKWFEYQSEGSSIDIKLPLEWPNNNFLGFVLCVVGYSYSNIGDVGLNCEINPKPNQGEDHKDISGFNSVALPTMSDSSNVYMWQSHHVRCSKYLDAVEVSFKFYALDVPFPNTHDAFETSEFEVKKCGIHILYSTEFEEVRLNGINSFSFSDAIANKTESSSGGIIDFYMGEPHPKRIKF